MPTHSLRIGIDGNEANVVNRVGSNEYAYQILVALEKQLRSTEDQVHVFLTQAPLEDLPAERTGWEYVIVSPRKFATQFALPLELYKRRQQLDVLYTPSHYAPRYCPVPYISSVMDLAFFDFPQQFKTMDLFQLKNWTRYSVRKANHVIAISQATKDDIVYHYGISPEKISIAYPAIGEQITQKASTSPKQILQKFDIHQPYILYVGTIQPRKNLVQLIDAFEVLKNRIEKGRKIRQEDVGANALQLVIAGKIGWLAGDVLRKVERSPWQSDIRMIGYITDEEKHVLYKKAACSTLIGLYEGFGMPALESLALNTVPVVSKTTSLPEVVGEAGILVDPTSSISIAKGLEKAITMNAQERAVFLMQAKAQVKKFSWDESAQVIVDQLRQLHA